MSYSISVTGARGVPKYKIGLGTGRMVGWGLGYMGAWLGQSWGRGVSGDSNHKGASLVCRHFGQPIQSSLTPAMCAPMHVCPCPALLSLNQAAEGTSSHQGANPFFSPVVAFNAPASALGPPLMTSGTEGGQAQPPPPSSAAAAAASTPATNEGGNWGHSH